VTDLSARRAHVVDAIARAPEHRLPTEILAIRGLGTAPAQRCALLNLLCRLPGCRYLEFGSFMGQSLLAAAFRNAGAFRGVENFSQFTSVPARDGLRRNLDRARALGCGDVSVQEIDWREYAGGPVDVFFYDAEHDAASTRDALCLVAPHLVSGALIVVDDWELPTWSGHVQSGVFEGRELAGLRIVDNWELPRDEGWHEGVYVALVGGRARRRTDTRTGPCE
jgi:predicted O-methyltransferase YrrM